MQRKRTAAYTCQHFARDVWLALCDEDLAARIAGLLAPCGQHRLVPSQWRAFKRLPAPVDPCLMLCTQHGKDPHIGVYMRGRVFHLAAFAPAFVSLSQATAGYTDIRFYK